LPPTDAAGRFAARRPSGFDGVELGDARERFGGDGRIAALGDLEEATSNMRLMSISA
jgi:hypothetical protein